MITASLLRRRSRMIVALLSIAIGATILSGLVTIYYDVPRQMGAEFRNYGANMIFTPAGESLTLDEVKSGAAMIDKSKLVGYAPYRYENVRINNVPLIAAGTDLKGAKATSPYWHVDGSYPGEAGELMIGENVSKSFRLKEGDTVTVTYTTENSVDENGIPVADNFKDFTVTAILDTGGSEEDFIYMSLEDMETLTGDAGDIDIAELSIQDSTGDELSSMAGKISGKYPGISARLVKRVTASETAVLSKLKALVLLVTVIVLALTMICVATTMTAVVAERRKEIGLRKAIGASDKSIISEFLGESMLLGCVGGILGAVLGFIFAQQVSVNVFSSSISFRPMLVPITIFVSVAVTGLSSLFPIKSATEVDPALVLKGE